MDEFFDQGTNEDLEDSDVSMERPNGASIRVNGSYQPVEVGSPFIATLKNVARQAGFGKFKAFRNGVEIKPSNAPSEFSPEDRVEIRPFDEAG